MFVCDICSAPGTGTIVSSEDMRKAVKKGFNPFALGLIKSPLVMLNPSMAFEGWKNTIVAQDTSDWNICAQCMFKLRPHMDGPPRPTGVTKATVSTAPLFGFPPRQTLEQQKAELQKKEVEPPKRKRRWQFWKK